jgi:hypothetical protein
VFQYEVRCLKDLSQIERNIQKGDIIQFEQAFTVSGFYART